MRRAQAEPIERDERDERDEPRAPLQDQLFAGFDEYRANRQSAKALRTIGRAAGIEQTRTKGFGNSMEILRGQLRLAQQLGRTDEVEQLTARLAQAEADLQDPERLARFDAARGELTETLQSAIDKGKTLRARAASVPLSKPTRETVEADGFKQAFGELADDPLRIIAELGIRSAPNMIEIIPAMVGGAYVGGPFGAAAGAGAASAAVEYRASVAQSLREAGVDLDSAESMLEAAANTELMESVYKKAAIRAGIIGAADAATAGVAGRVLTPLKQPLAREASNLAAQMGVQMAGGAGGEAGAQLATEGRIRAGDVLAEAVGETVTAPGEVAAAAAAGLRAQPQVSRADIESPIPTDLIVAGRQLIDDAIAGKPLTPAPAASPLPEPPLETTQAPAQEAPSASVEPALDTPSSEAPRPAAGVLDPNGLKAFGGGAAQAISANLRDRLWAEYEGRATLMDPLVRRARAEAPGMTREQLVRWVENPPAAVPASATAPTTQPLQTTTPPSEAEIVDQDEDLGSRTRADMAGETPQRARLIAVRNFLNEWLEDYSVPPELNDRVGPLYRRIADAIDAGTDSAALEAEVAAELRDWQKANIDGDVAEEVRALSQGFERVAASAATPLQTTPSSAAAAAPTLYAEWNGQRYPVESVDDAKAKWAQFREASGGGSSELGSARLTNAAGEHVGTISYNGRFWPLKAAVAAVTAPAPAPAAPLETEAESRAAIDRLQQANLHRTVAESVDNESAAKPSPLSQQKIDALRGLVEQAGWAQIGGRVLREGAQDATGLVGEGQGAVTGRTEWIPKAEWWPGRPGGFNEAQTAAIVEKGINGKLLGKTQRAYFDYLNEVADQLLAVADWMPTAEELQADAHTPSVDDGFDVSLVARANEIDENAVEQAARQYENDDAGFLRAVKAIIDANAAPARDSQASERTPASEVGEPATAAPDSQRESVVQQQASPANERPAPLDQRGRTDLFGQDTRSAQALADEQRRRDDARSPNKDVPLETGDPTDLFSKARQQVDLVDAARAPATARKGPEVSGSQDTAPPASDKPAAPSVESKPKAAAPKPGALDDFGSKLEGARKDTARSLSREYSDEDLIREPFSKVWPAGEIDEIEDVFAAAVAHTARALVPTKPRKEYAVKRWVENAKTVRGLAQRIVSGEVTREKFLDKADSYKLKDFKSKVRLLEQLDRGQWSRVEKVAEAPGAYQYGPDGKQVATPMVSVTIDGRHHWLEGSGDVMDHVDAVRKLLGTEAKAKRMEFEVRGRGDKWFINKKGDSEYRQLRTFSSSEEALKFRKENYDALVAAWEGVKARDNVSERDVRSAENRPRAGADYRSGKDATPEQFTETFGFRGVQFGNWVGQGKGAKDRQGMLNQAYDALMDLANIIDVPPKALSLNGTLGLAFGARGSGWASAHYEPDTLVINLTKTRGAGSLGHEWFHAADNYFAHQRGGEIKLEAGMSQEDYRQANYITYRPEPMMVRKDGRGSRMTRTRLEEQRRANPTSAWLSEGEWQVDPQHPNGVRPQVEKAFANLVDALNASPMAARARSIDKSANGYWSRVIERAARSFENYLLSKMMERGFHNDYLANVRSVDQFERDKGRYPYLLPEEVAPVAKAFDALFETIDTRETDAGVEMFSLGNEQSDLGFFSGLRAAVDGLKQEKGTAEQMLAAIRKTPGVKEDEIEWTGLGDYLKARGSVTKTELLAFLDAEGVKIEEVTFGAGEVNPLDKRIGDLTVELDALGFDIQEDPDGFLDQVRERSSNRSFYYARESDQWMDSNEIGIPMLQPETERILDTLRRAMNERANSENEDNSGAQFEKWTLPGGENYREVLLTLPATDSPAGLARRKAVFDEYQQRIDALRAQLDLAPQRRAFPRTTAELNDQIHVLQVERDGKANEAYTLVRDRPTATSHWPIDNVLAHVRLKDRTTADGKKVLFVEEVQSDWAQKGRKKGFSGTWTPEKQAQMVQARKALERAIENDDNLGFDTVGEARGAIMQHADYASRWEVSPATVRAAGAYLPLQREYMANKEAIPRGPFVEKTDAWAGLAIKRVMRMAVDGGYDAIAWTTGEQQAERYDLSKHIDVVEYELASPGPDGSQRWEVIAEDKSGRRIIDEDEASIERVEELLGKDIAKRILNDQGTKIPDRPYREWRELRGLDLKVGGEGMIGFYDNIVPKLFKKLGGKVEPMQVDTTQRDFQDGRAVWAGPPTVTQQPGIVLTDAMREKIGAGLPLFSVKPTARATLDATLTDLQSRLKQVGISDRVALKLLDDIRGKDGSFVPGAQGRYFQRIIEIALTTADKRHTLDHEIVHALKDLGVIRDAEWKALTAAAEGDRALMQDIHARYKGLKLSREKFIEEAIADMHANWAAGKLKPKGFVKSAFERISNFFEALRNALRGNGFQSAADVFERIGSGEMGKRPSYARGGIKQKAPAFAVGAAAATAPTDNRLLDEAIFRFQDKFRYLDKAQRAAATDRGVAELPEAEDAYLAELRYHGMAGAAIEDFQRDHVEPLVEAISKAGLTVKDVDDYLHARHAPEANAHLKRINPDRTDNEALSGMSDAEAAKVIASFKRNGHVDALDMIAERVDAITKAQRDLLVSAGLEAADTVKQWEATYQHYVPLHREGFEQAGQNRGKGFSVTGKQKRRAGSTRDVEHILAHVVAQYETATVRAEKNKVARAMLEFATANPNANLYEVDKVEYTPSFDADGLVTYRPQRGFQLADNVLVVKVDGKDHTVSFNERSHEAMRMAHALKNLGADHSGAIFNTLSRFTRYLAIVNTGMNPEFIISNFARDLQTAGYNLSSTEADKLKWQIIKDVGKSWRGIRAFQKRSGKHHVWAQHFDEFRKAGAQTGWMDHYRDVAHREKKLVKMVEDLRGSTRLLKIRSALGAVGQFINDENTAVENAIRLSAFVHARKAGLTEAKAARLAKELTVNFNRKGDYGQTMNALYLFYNASIQGSARIVAAAAKSPKVRALMGATVVFAMFLDMLNRELGGDDEDGKARYDKIPDYIKERNLIIMLPDGAGDYLQIPLPWGYNVFHVMGQTMGEALTKPGFKPTEAGMRVAGSVWGAFNPIGSEASLLQMVSPTITDPLAQWGENKDWSGRQLRPEGNPFDIDQPNSQQYWNSVREPSRWVAEQLNELTGGNTVRSGAVDVNPEAIDLAIDTFTGGAGRFVSDTLSTPIKVVKGEDVESYEVPLLRRLYGRLGAGAVSEDYYRNADAVRVVEKEAKHYRETGDRESLEELRRDRRAEYMLIEARKNVENEISKLRQMRNRVEGARSLSAAEKRARTEVINERIEQNMRRFNSRYNARVIE